MEGYDHRTYGDAFADVYDNWYSNITDVDTCVATVADLARSVSRSPTPLVLELGIGTGRVAIPLADAGIDVRGIDGSAAMVERLRSHPGGEHIPVLLGDFADVRLPPAHATGTGGAPPVPEPVDLVLCAYNTFFNLPNHELQWRCVWSATQMLAPGGRLVIEAFVPPPQDHLAITGDPDPSLVRVRHLAADVAVLTAAVRDAQAQTLTGQFVELRESGITLRPWHIHYRYPEEIDALAEGAGLRLEHRWGGWDRSTFGEQSASHVSVYRRPGP